MVLIAQPVNHLQATVLWSTASKPLTDYGSVVYSHQTTYRLSFSGLQPLNHLQAMVLMCTASKPLTGYLNVTDDLTVFLSTGCLFIALSKVYINAEHLHNVLSCPNKKRSHFKVLRVCFDFDLSSLAVLSGLLNSHTLVGIGSATHVAALIDEYDI